MMELFIIFLLIFVVLGGIALIYGFKKYHKYRIIQDTPRSKIRSMAMGLVEVHGHISGTNFIRTPFSNRDCIYYRYVIKEYRRHTSTDSKGRTRVRYSWDTIGSGERRTTFFAKDETGEVFVDPTKAEISAPLKGVFYQHRGGFFGGIAMIIHALSDWDSGKNNEMNTSGWNLTPMGTNDHMFGASVGDRKYYEYYLEPNENLFLLGTAANSPDAPNNVLIRKGTNEPIFMISHKSEGQVVSSLRWQSIGLLLLGSILIIIGIIIPLYLSYGF